MDWLRSEGYVHHAKGLFDDDGMTAGSGFQLSYYKIKKSKEFVNYKETKMITKTPKELNTEDYIRELEVALIFMCGCYVSAKNAVSVREDSNGEVDDRYVDIMLAFPMIQGIQNLIAVTNIANLRTLRSNYEANSISLTEIYEIMKNKRGRIKNEKH